MQNHFFFFCFSHVGNSRSTKLHSSCCNDYLGYVLHLILVWFLCRNPNPNPFMIGTFFKGTHFYVEYMTQYFHLVWKKLLWALHIWQGTWKNKLKQCKDILSRKNNCVIDISWFFSSKVHVKLVQKHKIIVVSNAMFSLYIRKKK
jgi:hypothetical protein